MTQDEATKRFYRHVWPVRATVLRTAMFLCRSAADAEDLAQETMLKAYRAIGQFDERSNAQAWVMAILRNTRIDRLRSQAARPTGPSIEAEEIDVAEERSAEMPRTDEELRDAARLIEGFSDQTMIDALKKLPEEIRWTLLLADVEQLDYVQASEILGVPVGTVKSRVHRGRGMLKEMLLQKTASR